MGACVVLILSSLTSALKKDVKDKNGMFDVALCSPKFHSLQ